MHGETFQTVFIVLSLGMAIYWTIQAIKVFLNKD